ncbi:peptidoglycan bridge formation glycyltransferase FemA/FemB family protein [Treponema sp.]|uniref:lipid II:glycine glycyltransferase FemX n=1 Tax=Treponema sp. TaxID=166 RepID=UPI0025EAA63E|nr:peptidoglycan bridge formation glycyltransferase FemA/FemB family protein [Treponema sp.]MCR5218354.1 peptidoglycan bridge formation glycyltransferase FemA/FemB family protein [Treponema sp.]
MQKKRFLQEKFWCDFKGQHGWNPIYFDDGNSHISLMTREFSLKVKKFSIAYVPMAPEYIGSHSLENDLAFFNNVNLLSQKIKALLPENTLCIRYDFPVDFSDTEERDKFIKASPALCKKAGCKALKHSKIAVQPPDTTVLDLSKSEEEIMAGMKNKWRYNVRLASKKGVVTECYDAGHSDFEKYFDIFYSLFETTSRRDGVSFHGKKYYIDLLKKSAEDKNNPSVKLYLARHENDYLAGIITLFCQGEAVYLYGASGNIKRNLMPAYLLQWTAICDAKKYGCPSYDFYGMPPSDDPDHPMHGLYLFKTGFGGDIIHRPGSYDYVLKNNWYKLYCLAERFRAWWHRVLLKKISGR